MTVHDLPGNPVMMPAPVAVDAAGDVSLPIDVSRLASGTYVVNVAGEGERTRTKLVIVR